MAPKVLSLVDESLAMASELTVGTLTGRLESRREQIGI